jgi:hypothetical protein
MTVTDAVALLREEPTTDPAVTEAATRIRERLTLPDAGLPTAGPGDVVRLAGVWGGECHAHVVELAVRGLMVRVVGVVMLARGTWRRGAAGVFDVVSIEPWKLPTAPRARRPRRQPEARG